MQSQHNGAAAWRPFDNPQLIELHRQNANALLADNVTFFHAFGAYLNHPQTGLKVRADFKFEICSRREPGHLVEVGYGSSEVRLQTKRCIMSRQLLGPRLFSEIEPGEIVRAWRRDGDGHPYLRLVVGGPHARGAR